MLHTAAETVSSGVVDTDLDAAVALHHVAVIQIAEAVGVMQDRTDPVLLASAGNVAAVGKGGTLLNSQEACGFFLLGLLAVGITLGLSDSVGSATSFGNFLKLCGMLVATCKLSAGTFVATVAASHVNYGVSGANDERADEDSGGDGESFFHGFPC